jgi:N-acetylglutamate synthase-like GNAT family acetyltransferase
MTGSPPETKHRDLPASNSEPHENHPAGGRDSDTRDLFRALELAHYAARFREQVFVIALPSGGGSGGESGFEALLVDLKVLAGYRIQLALVAADPMQRMEKAVSVANKRGGGFEYIPAEIPAEILTEIPEERNASSAPEKAPEKVPGKKEMQPVWESIQRGKLPVIALPPSLAKEAANEGGDASTPPAGGLMDAYRVAGRLASGLGARKLFLVSHLAGPLRQAIPRTSIAAEEMEGLPEKIAGAGQEEASSLCAFVRDCLSAGIPDVIVLEGREGQLFREVFTYEGAGVLFNAYRETRIRRAEMRDVMDIALLLRPEIAAERIRPIVESEIEAAIGNYWVYEMDDMPVGLACLKGYGEEAEMAQFTTLPRFRGKGRARELAIHLAGVAHEQGFQRVFALSTDPRMWDFFLSLGFSQVERGELPPQWRAEYDMSRPSRAFRKTLGQP